VYATWCAYMWHKLPTLYDFKPNFFVIPDLNKQRPLFMLENYQFEWVDFFYYFAKFLIHCKTGNHNSNRFVTSEKISSDGLLETTPSDLLRANGSQVPNVDLRPWLGELCCEATFKFLSATTLRSDASLLSSKFEHTILNVNHTFDHFVHTWYYWIVHLGGSLISLLLWDYGTAVCKMQLKNVQTQNFDSPD
jgi:hypothetical protein